jgi:hypothetical protein
MGYARWSSADWDRYAAVRSSRSRAEIFSSRQVPADLDPAKFRGRRESRDSVANPASNAIVIGADVTGSMGLIAETLVRQGIGTAFEEILARAADPNAGMIADPHLLVMGLGDVACDRGPIQVTQFEADIRIAEQLERIWLEGGGGGNNHESYDLAWYFAAMRTTIDCFEKRGRKGYLFTVGDEEAPNGLTKEAIRHFLGDRVQADLTSRQLLAMAARTYYVFHIVVEEGSYARSNLAAVARSWRSLLGERVLMLPDHTKLAEVIVSAIAVNEGASIDETARSWSGNTSLVVANVLRDLRPAESPPPGGIVRFAARRSNPR